MPPAARPVQPAPTVRAQADLLAVLPWDSWETVPSLSRALRWPDDRTLAVLLTVERGGYAETNQRGGWRKCPLVRNSR